MALNISTAIARVYAAALLEIGDAAGKTDALLEDLHAVANALYADKSIQSFFESPKVPNSDKVAFMERVFKGQIDEEVFAFLLVLIKKKREPQLDNIVKEFRFIHDVQRGKIHVEAQVARRMDDGVFQQLQKELERVTGKTVILREKEDKNLIGGIVIRVGDLVLDGSIRKRLEDLREQTIEATRVMLAGAGSE